ncbi:MAG: hypothetical protein ACQETO_07425 [Pseudomonadota bacterium]
MALTYEALKERQRRERDQHPEGLALRVHRALSWLRRAEQCEDADGRFIFLWIAFNAAYSDECGEYRPREGQRFRFFLERLVDLDGDGALEAVLWNQFSGAIRVLLDNRYVFQPFWDHLNGLPESEDWEQRFSRAKAASSKALASRDVGALLSIVFNRLYTLRNQLIHGGATWGSSVNRNQLRDGNRILSELVPLVIEIMMDHHREHWGDACYPVHQM